MPPVPSVSFCCLLVLFSVLYEDALNNKKERTVASADCVLEIVHELEKGNSPRVNIKI